MLRLILCSDSSYAITCLNHHSLLLTFLNSEVSSSAEKPNEVSLLDKHGQEVANTEVKILEYNAGLVVHYQHVPGAKNSEADALARISIANLMREMTENRIAANESEDPANAME